MPMRNRQVMVRLTPDEARQVLALAKLRRQSVGALLVDLARPLIDATRPAQPKGNADGRNPSAFVASQAGAGDATPVSHTTGAPATPEARHAEA